MALNGKVKTEYLDTRDYDAGLETIIKRVSWVSDFVTLGDEKFAATDVCLETCISQRVIDKE